MILSGATIIFTYLSHGIVLSMVNFCFVCPCNFASQAIPLGILQTMSSYVCLLWTDDVKNYRTWQEFDEVLCIETVPRHTVSPKTVVLQHHLHHRPSIISVLKWQIWTNFARTHLATKAVTSAPTTGIPPCISLYYISRWAIWCHISRWAIWCSTSLLSGLSGSHLASPSLVKPTAPLLSDQGQPRPRCKIGRHSFSQN